MAYFLLIYVFSKYNVPLLEHLKENLESKGFVLVPRSNKEVMEKIISTEENRYIRKLVNLICRFISNFKTNGYTVDDFNRMYHSTQNVRTRLFLEICNECYLEYEKYLRENLLYAKFDDELWEILQDAESREYIRRNIITRFLTKQ